MYGFQELSHEERVSGCLLLHQFGERFHGSRVPIHGVANQFGYVFPTQLFQDYVTCRAVDRHLFRRDPVAGKWLFPRSLLDRHR